MRPSALLRDQRAMFVVINLAVNLLFLLRSYVFMLVLDYRDLGLIAVLQSIVLLLGILQFGVLNGGYRLLLSADADERGRIVNFVYSFIALIGAASIIVALLIFPAVDRPEDGVMALAGAVGGAATLIRTWQTNQLIAAGRLALLNTINLGSALLSLAFLFLVPVDPLTACIATLVSQPIMFAAAAWVLARSSRPSSFELSRERMGRMLGAGFIIFVAGMLLQVNVQLERAYVVAELGITPLGHLFLAIMVLALIQLVPNALDAIFLPSAVRAHGEGDAAGLARSMRTYLLLLAGYALAAAVGLWLLAEPVVAYLAPRYVADLRYVYLIAPGALVLALSSAFALSFSVLIRYRYLLIAYGVGTAALALALGGAMAIGRTLSLAEVTMVRSAGLTLTGVLVVAGWWVVSRSVPGLRFVARAPGRN